MKNIIVSMQEVLWDGDGGNHDPVAASITDEHYEWIASLHDGNGEKQISDEFANRIQIIMFDAADIEFPATIDGMFNFWYEYE